MTLTLEDTNNLPPSQYDEMTSSSNLPQSWRSVAEVVAAIRAGVTVHQCSSDGHSDEPTHPVK